MIQVNLNIGDKNNDKFTFVQDEELLEIFGWMVAINPVGQVKMSSRNIVINICFILLHLALIAIDFNDKETQSSTIVVYLDDFFSDPWVVVQQTW